MDFVLQSDSEVNGKVNLSLIHGEQKKGLQVRIHSSIVRTWQCLTNRCFIMQIAKGIPVTNGEAEAPITIPIWKLSSGDYSK